MKHKIGDIVKTIHISKGTIIRIEKPSSVYVIPYLLEILEPGTISGWTKESNSSQFQPLTGYVPIGMDRYYWIDEHEITSTDFRETNNFQVFN